LQFVTLKFKISDGKDLFEVLDKRVRLCAFYSLKYIKKQELTSADITEFLREFIPRYVTKNLVSIFDKMSAKSSSKKILNP